jgi:hypothetical protein
MHLVDHMVTLGACEAALADAHERVASAHAQESGVMFVSTRLREMSLRRQDLLRSQMLRLANGSAAAATDPWAQPRHAPGTVPLDGETPDWSRLLQDLTELYLRASECEIGWTVLLQGARAARDPELTTTAQECLTESARHVLWAKSQLKQAAPQALVVS